MSRDKDNDQMLLLRDLVGQGNVITFPRLFFNVLKDIEASLLLGQLVFWSGKGNDPEGWIWKSYKNLKDEICLTEKQVRRARRKLEVLDLIEVKIKKAFGNPTVHYRLKANNLLKLLVSAQRAETKPPEGQERNLPKGRNETSRRAGTLTDLTSNPTTDDFPGSSSSFFPPTSGPEGEKIINQVTELEYPGQKISRNLQHTLLNLLENGKLEIPEGWENCREERQPSSLEKEDDNTVENHRFKAACKAFEGLPQEEKEKYYARAREVSNGFISPTSPALRSITICEFMRDHPPVIPQS